MILILQKGGGSEQLGQIVGDSTFIYCEQKRITKDRTKNSFENFQDFGTALVVVDQSFGVQTDCFDLRIVDY